MEAKVEEEKFQSHLYNLPFNSLSLNSIKTILIMDFSIVQFIAATFTEGGAPNTLIVTDSKTNTKEATGVATTTTASTLGPPSLSVGNHLDIPQNNNPNLLSPDVLSQRRGEACGHQLITTVFIALFLLSRELAGSRRPSILPVPDMFTSSSFSISGEDGLEGDNNDESEDELDDPWRSPSEKIA